jgi:hypothetical protein
VRDIILAVRLRHVCHVLRAFELADSLIVVACRKSRPFTLACLSYIKKRVRQRNRLDVFW